MALSLNDVNSRASANRDNAQLNRAVQTADPDFDVGMDDAFDDFSDLDSGGTLNSGFGSSDSSFDSGFGSSGSGFDSGFGSSGFGSGMDSGFGGSSNFGMTFGAPTTPAPTTPTNDNQSPEDKFFAAAASAGKSSMNFFKALVQSFKTVTPVVRGQWGRYTMTIGIITAVVGGITMPLLRFQLGLELLVGGIISAATGIVILCFAQDAISAGGAQPSEPELPSADNTWDSMPSAEMPAFEDSFDSQQFGFDDDDDEEVSEDWGSSEDTDDSWGSDNSWNSEESWIEPEPEPAPVEADFDTARAALDTLAGNGLFDRRSLFERQMMVLAHKTPDFAKQTEIGQGEETFNSFDAVIQEAGETVRTGNSNEYPLLRSALETLFYYRLEISRPKFIKNVDQFTQEIVNVMQYDKRTGTRDMSIYGVGEAIGQNIYIKLMKGETAFVTLKDIYKTHQEEILNYENKMPIVLGVDIEGNPVIRDFYKIDSILITGQPRTGKTWLMLSVLYQMMCYMSPDELQFYIMDPKGKMSDFAHSITPHIRNFISEDAQILAQLAYIVRVEGARRKEIIGQAGFVNIQDYNKANPGNAMPFLYVIIDEVVTLTARMEKETGKEFQSLLFELVSQLPAAGVRLFLVPHLVKDNIVKKNTTSLIACRVSVMGNAEHIEDSCGVKNFPHKLSHMGDTCTVLKGEPDAMFVHSVALAASNEENVKLFEYLGDMWAKICPGSVAGSVYERVKNGGDVVDNGSAATAMQTLENTTSASHSTSQHATVQQAQAAVQQMQMAVQQVPSAASAPRQHIENTQSIATNVQRGGNITNTSTSSDWGTDTSSYGFDDSTWDSLNNSDTSDDDVDSWGNSITMNGESYNPGEEEEVDLFDDDF